MSSRADASRDDKLIDRASHPADRDAVIEFDAASGGWLVTYSGTWWGIALRDYRPAAEAIRRKANGMPQLPGDDFLLSLAPHGHEHGPAYEEGKWTVA